GNCLFNALSDQIYGDESKNMEIRANVVEYMREHKGELLPFIDVNDGQRRNPKRKNTADPQNTPFSEGPTEAARENAFEDRLHRMAQFGTYGDNMEILAFAKCYNHDVRIYSHRGHVLNIRAADDDQERPIAWIAHHVWEHYSSVRCVDGPFEGLPNVQPKNVAEGAAESTETFPDRGPAIQDWQIKVVQTSAGNPLDEDHMGPIISERRGHFGKFLSNLLENDEHSSTSGTPGRNSDLGSSSVERDVDSEDEDFHAPRKKQDRKKSHATKPTNHLPVGRTQSTSPSTPPLRPRIILQTASQRAKLKRQRAKTSSIETTPPPTAEEEAQITSDSEKKRGRTLITAREMKRVKQWKGAKERKQQKTKGPSPPVHTLGTLTMIQI
ncbi:putative OTU domain-containing protein 3, partial [Amylocarpus encephaloides]